MRPAEVRPAVLASCGSLKREINRKCASLVTPEICRSTAGDRPRRQERLRLVLLQPSVFLLLKQEENDPKAFKKKNNYSFKLAAVLFPRNHKNPRSWTP